MTNLEWIRTLSAKELSDLLYDYWLPRGQYVWTDSRKGLMKVLGEKYLERDCDKCKHQGNCYCVKGLGCPFEPKDENSSEIPNNYKVKNYCDDCLYTDTCDSKEFFYACTSKPTISKMEQVDKDINVRSEDEPRKGQNFCGKCRYLYRDFKYGLSCYRLMDNEPCKYEERKDEPQTDCHWK